MGTEIKPGQTQRNETVNGIAPQHRRLEEQEAPQLRGTSARLHAPLPSGYGCQTSVVLDLPIVPKLNTNRLKCLRVLKLPASYLGYAVRENIFYNTKAEKPLHRRIQTPSQQYHFWLP